MNTGKTVGALTVALLSFAIFSGCHVTEIRIGGSQLDSREAPGKLKPPSEQYQYVSLGFGIYDMTRETHEECPANPESILIETDLMNTVIHYIIGGIYTRRNIRVYCDR